MSRVGEKARAVRGMALAVGEARALGQVGLEEAKRQGLGSTHRAGRSTAETRSETKAQANLD